jgi:hypothetical protein
LASVVVVVLADTLVVVSRSSGQGSTNIMSSASSYASSHGAMASRLRTLVLGSKPYINIVLNEERSSYSTLNKLSGKVEIAVSHSTTFDEIDIHFIGMLCDIALLPHGDWFFHQEMPGRFRRRCHRHLVWPTTLLLSVSSSDSVNLT